MIPYSSLPDRIEWDGREIKLTLYYDRVIEALDVLQDDSFSAIDKLDYVLFLLAVDAPREVALLRSILDMVLPDKKPSDKTRFIDFKQDWDLIYAGFWQAYGLDLIEERGRLHYAKFRALLQGLPKDTRMAEVIHIRTMPVPDPTPHNAKERAEIMRLKSEYAIKFSAEEREQNYQAGLQKIAWIMMQHAKR